MDIACWKCGKQINDLSLRISFKELCPHCHSYLHCCKNCVNYQEGLSNNCKIPGTEPISDREARNCCEEFTLLGKAPPPKNDPKKAFRKLFGED